MTGVQTCALPICDPITLAQRELTEAKILAPERITEIDRAIAAEIEGAVAFAERSPDPLLAEMFTDVYAPF